jgi:transposase
MRTNTDYTGHTIFIGVDVHKRNYVVAVVLEGTVARKFSMEAKPSNLTNYIKKNFNEANEVRTVYEAGFCGFGLHRMLKNAGFSSIVVNPASINIEANNRVKTDKKDAVKLAMELYYNRLRPIYVPNELQEAHRILLRTREQISKQRAKVANQIKSKLTYLGKIECCETRKISIKYIKELKTRLRNLPDEIVFSMDLLFDNWIFLTRKLFSIRRRIRSAAKKSNIEPIYRSVPGIGEISSQYLIAELGNMSRFKNEKQLFSYTGLTPCEYSSGDKVRRGNISRQGPPRLRNLMVEAAWRAIRDDPSLKKMYENISIRRGGNRAIVAIARKLIGRIRSCLKQNTFYVINKEGLAGV